MWWLRAAFRHGARGYTQSLQDLLHHPTLSSPLAQLAPVTLGAQDGNDDARSYILPPAGCTAHVPCMHWSRQFWATPTAWQDSPTTHDVAMTATTVETAETAAIAQAAAYASMSPAERARAIAAAKKRRPPWFLRTPRRDPNEPGRTHQSTPAPHHAHAHTHSTTKAAQA